jgi:hypothetical protein
MKRRRCLRFVDGMRHQGLVKRLGVKGWAVWALKSYRGATPRVVHVRAAPMRPRRPDVVRPQASSTSWWLELDREAFTEAARVRAHDQGWDR